jgi:hypothetical protein
VKTTPTNSSLEKQVPAAKAELVREHITMKGRDRFGLIAD